jgi:hypothetical protein
MKRFAIIGAVAALFAMLLFMWTRRGNDVAPGNSEDPIGGTQHVRLAHTTNSNPDVAASMPSNESVVAGSIAFTTNQDNEFELIVRKSTEAANIPVAFYGVVVDQDSNALQNVSVDLQVIEERVDSFPQHNQKRTPLQRLTGADGRFEVVGDRPKGQICFGLYAYERRL